jgi:hypothetical protein
MAGGVDEDPHTFPGVTSVRALGKDFTSGSLPGTAADARGNFVAAVDDRVVDQSPAHSAALDGLGSRSHGAISGCKSQVP